MDTPQITESLSRLFHSEGHRIIFWKDPDQEFLDTFPQLDLDDGVKVNYGKFGKLLAEVKAVTGGGHEAE